MGFKHGEDTGKIYSIRSWRNSWSFLWCCLFWVNRARVMKMIGYVCCWFFLFWIKGWYPPPPPQALGSWFKSLKSNLFSLIYHSLVYWRIKSHIFALLEDQSRLQIGAKYWWGRLEIWDWELELENEIWV